MSVENRFFEVTTPEGVKPGETINLIVRAEPEDESKFKSVVDVRDAVLNQAKQGADALGITERVQGLNEKYHVTDRAQSFTNSAVTRVSDFDTRFAISSRVNSILASLDSRLHVQAAAIKTGEYIIGCKLHTLYSTRYTLSILLVPSFTSSQCTFPFDPWFLVFLFHSVSAKEMNDLTFILLLTLTPPLPLFLPLYRC